MTNMKFFGWLVFCLFTTVRASLPVVLWHGMGDSCCEHGSLGRIITLIKQKIPDVHLVSFKFGNNTFEDVDSSYFMGVNKQVEVACETIRSDPLLKGGYNAIGFSQGGQFLRALAQRCPYPRMNYLISLGGQHQGVYGLPRCNAGLTLCKTISKLLNRAAYVEWVQNTLVQAQYWHDPVNEEVYKERSVFLADINNEKPSKNESYARNLQKLKGLVLVLFTEDSMVVPRESSWFGFYAPGQANEVVAYNETQLFQEDLIGLRRMVNEGKVDFLSVNGDHLQFTKEWFTETIIQRYLM